LTILDVSAEHPGMISRKKLEEIEKKVRTKAKTEIDPEAAAKLYGADSIWADTFDRAVKTAKLQAINALREQAEKLGLSLVARSETPRLKPGPKPGAKKPGPKPGSAKGKPGPKGKDKTAEQESIKAALKGNGWVNVVSLNKNLGFKSGDFIGPLLTAKTVLKKGERRSTEYKLA
jgi:hypothetical protein